MADCFKNGDEVYLVNATGMLCGGVWVVDSYLSEVNKYRIYQKGVLCSELLLVPGACIIAEGVAIALELSGAAKRMPPYCKRSQ